MKKLHISKRFTTDVSGKLRTEEQWLDIFDWREEQAREVEKERQEAAMEADMVWYEGRRVPSLYREEMLRW